MDPGDLQSKRTVFLCHSGAQKGFVTQLDKDLREADRYPFFDRDKESLPIGDYFPDVIFKAIEECEVGVVILSEEFFMRSPWPMFEVVKMVECGRTIMPVFLGISPEDLSKETNLVRWKSEWEGWEKSNKRIDVSKWEGALRRLRGLNGLVYKDAGGVVAFRGEIVKEICKVVAAFHRWDDSHVQGKSRLSKIIQEEIANTAVDRGVRVMGLYGVGGIGKTTACKSLCNDLSMEFGGRVRHVEFGNDKNEKERVQEVLRRLTRTSNEFLNEKNLDVDECWSRLKVLMPKNKVFLAIDNVSSNSKVSEEARKYLKLEYREGSVVMVTARGRDELKGLGMDGGSCVPMPDLVEDEARELFLDCTGCENVVDEGVVMRCIKRCYFGKGAGKSGHYHPLALKVLGSQMVGRDPREWESQLEGEDVFNGRREQEHPVFSILRRSFDELLDVDKDLFMDVALYDFEYPYVDLYEDALWTIRDSEIFESHRAWLSIVHGLNMGVLKERLDGLKVRALLEEVGDGSTQIGMHDLWREFAVKETERGEQHRRRWVYEAVEGKGGDSCLSRGGWKKLRRICIISKDWFPLRSVKCMEFSDCSNVTVLKLVGVGVENQEVDLSPLRHLKSLEIYPRYRFRDIGLKVSGIKWLVNLAVLIWLNINCELLSAVREISFLRNLEMLQLSCRVEIPRLCTMLALDELRLLREVRIEFRDTVTISGCSSRMSKLRIVNLSDCHRLRSCPGVGDVVDLEVLSFSGCSFLEGLPNLKRLTKLRILDISECSSLKGLPGLESLVALQELHASGCRELYELPDMRRLTNLEVLDLGGCEMLESTPAGFGNLVALQACIVDMAFRNKLPDLGKVTKFDKLVLGDSSEAELTRGVCFIRLRGTDSVLEFRQCLNLARGLNVSTLCLGSVPENLELTNLRAMTALKRLELDSCGFERLLDVSKHMTLESLKIVTIPRFRSWDGVRGLGWSESQTAEVDMHCDWTLPHLQELEWVGDSVVELPDFSHFPRLRSLEVLHNECFRFPALAVQCRVNHVHLEILIIEDSSISEVPDLSKFPGLKRLKLVFCVFLTSLTCSGPLPALERLELHLCSHLVDLPSFDLFPGLRFLEIHKCGVKLNALEVEKLRARCSYVFVDGDADSEPREGTSGTEVPSASESVHNSGSGVRDSIPGVESDCHLAMQVAREGPNHLDDGGPSSVQGEASCSSEFVPYNESIMELGRVAVPKRALELAGGGEIDKDRSKRLKDMQ